MSLKVLLRCSDTEFEKLISMMDLESILDIISELQNEMDQEQDKFDQLSVTINSLTDQSSAEFKKKSQELVKSQNRLALLMARNMHCFHLSQQLNDLVGEDLEDEPESAYTGSLTAAVHHNDQIDGAGTQLPNISQNMPTSNKKVVKKVVKIIHMSAPKKIEPSHISTTQPPPETQHTAPYTDTSSLHVKDTIDMVGQVADPIAEKKTSSMQFTVNSPRVAGEEVKPKRTLVVKSTGVSPVVSPRTPVGSTSEFMFHINDKASSTGDSVETNRLPSVTLSSSVKTSESPSNSLAAARQRFFASMEAPLSPTDDSTYSSLLLTSPRSITSIHLSPRSDISSNNNSPRHLDLSKLKISSILELDIPETSIDGDTNTQGQITPNSHHLEGVSDKVSCTTDESGFTSGSSDSDVTLAPPDIVYDYHSEDEEKVEERVFMKTWDPIKLLEDLYAIQLAKEIPINGHDVINMEGYLERLPLGKDKNTLLKTWKRTYCKAVDGIIYFYDSKSTPEAESYMSLMGGKLEELSNRMIGIDDMRGHYLMVRCASELDLLNWKRSFYTQIRCSHESSYIRPCLTSQPALTTARVIVIDLGSTSVRAGILGSSPSYPQVFFPCVSSTDEKGQVVVGFEAFQPQNRTNGIHRPVASSNEIDMYRINVQVLHELFFKVFTKLQVNQADYMVMLSCPHNFSSRLKEEVINILIGRFDVAGVNMVNQSLLVPYVYNATSGIVVDIGERIEIVAVTDGYLVEGGLNRQRFGGNRIADTLNSYLMEYRLYTTVEQLITRLVKEQTCFVSQDYGDDLLKYMCNESACEVTINLDKYDLPKGSHMRQISIDTARFKAPEGLLKTELLGIDNPTLPKLVEQAIMKCPMDVRREMWQSIYLSGGTTLLPGFPERLQKELGKIAPASVSVQIHASPHRYHAAYIGACMLAKLPNFTKSCISREEWRSEGVSCLNKWKKYFQG